MPQGGEIIQSGDGGSSDKRPVGRRAAGNGGFGDGAFKAWTSGAWRSGAWDPSGWGSGSWTAGFAGLEFWGLLDHQIRAAWDQALYDLSALFPEERRRFDGPRAARAAVLVVRPSGVGGVADYESLDAFTASDDAACAVLAVPSPGATALGAAAFGRNVADAVGEPVATVAPHALSGLQAWWSSVAGAGGANWSGAHWSGAHWGFGAPSGAASLGASDVATLLSHPSTAFDLLVGYSAGAQILAHALFQCEERVRATPGARSGLDDQVVITLAAAPRLPKRARARHVVGACDAVGWALSDADGDEGEILSPLTVGHHTNSQWPGHIDVCAMVRALDGRGRPGRRSPDPRRRRPEGPNRPKRRGPAQALGALRDS